MIRNNFDNVDVSTAVFILREALLAFATSKILLRQDQKFREKFERAYLLLVRKLLDFKVK